MPDALGFTLGGLAGLGALLDQLDRRRRADALQEMKLREGQGSFTPVPPEQAPEQSFLQRLLGGGTGPDMYDLGGGHMYQFTPYPELGTEGARQLFDIPGERHLSTMTSQFSAAPADYHPFASTPAGAPAVPPSETIPAQPVPQVLARLRMTPKLQADLALDKLKSDALDRRQEAVLAAREERARLAAQKDPGGVARLKWIASGLDSEDEDIQSVAQAELERLRSPGRRADTAAAKLDQDYDLAITKLDARRDEVDKRLKAALAAGDQRATLQAQRDQAALDRLRERLAAGGTSGKGASATEDMSTDEAIATLQDYRKRPYFPGQAADKLDVLEKVIAKTKADGKTTVPPVIAARLRRLGTQLDNAQRRERVPAGPTPTPAPSPAPAAGRQSSTTPSGTFSTSDQPSARMVGEYQAFYGKLSPEEAEADLRATIQADPLARALVTQAKQQAYVSLFPDRPMQLQIPASPQPVQPGTAAPAPVAAAPAPTAPAAQEPTAPVTPSPAPRQTPQDQVMQRYIKLYASMSDTDLAQEASRIAKDDPTGLDVRTAYRAQALDRVRAARQQAAALKAAQPPEVPAPPVQTTPQQALAYFRGRYQHLSTDELRAEQKRLMAADPLGKHIPTTLRLSVIQTLLAQRQASTPARTPAADEEP